MSQNWKTTNLGSLATYINGRGFKKSEWRDAGVPIVRIQNLTGTSEKINYFDGALDDKHRVEKGDLLLSWAATLDVYEYDQPIGALNQHIFKVEPLPGVKKKYLYYLLKTKLAELYAQTHGSGMVHITSGKFKATPANLPTPELQEKIVTKIEELFSELDANAHILENKLSRCDLLRASIIEYAYGGVSSESVKLSEVTDVITDGDHQAPPKSESGIPFIVISNIVDNRVALERSTRYVPKTYYDSLKDSRKARFGDVLYTVTGSFGIPVLIENNDEFCFQRHIALLRPNAETISSKYLFYVLQTDSVRKQAANIATGTAQLTVPLTGLRRISIPIIPLSKQREFVEKLELKLSELEGMTATIRDSRLLAKRMKQSILSKAFKGELV